MAPAGAWDGGAADLVLDAAEGQRWNEAQLAEPVTQPQMRVWTYRQGAIVLGRSQHAMAEQVAAGDGACEPDGAIDRLPLVKRGAGGGAVLVGPWLLSASLLLPLDDPRMAAVSVADSYRWLGEAMVAALATFGVQARAVPPAQRIAAPDDLKWACFAGVAPWEIVVDDPATGVARKLVGFAQRRSRHGMLLALGALMQPAPWRAMARTLGYPDAQADALARNDRLPVPRRAGLHILTGMAGRGALYAAIGAEMIAADACGEPPVVEATLARAVDPARFIKRRLQRAWSRRDSSGASGSAFADR